MGVNEGAQAAPEDAASRAASMGWVSGVDGRLGRRQTNAGPMPDNAVVTTVSVGEESRPADGPPRVVNWDAAEGGATKKMFILRLIRKDTVSFSRCICK